MDIKQQLKIYEGTKQYQTKLGYFKNDRFWIYKDHLGYPTIGYGHLILRGEDFSAGLTESEADALLDSDIATVREQLPRLQVNLPKDSRWNDFLVLMLFQVGLTKTLGFKKFLAALRSGNYATAVLEVRDSQWYRQTPQRVDDMIRAVMNG